MSAAQFSNVQRKNDRTMTFTLSPLTVTHANALRRIVLSGVETIAFRAEMQADGKTGNVVVEKNDTPMTNEMLAHRISMLPINIRDPLAYKEDEFTYILDVQNDGDRAIDVVAGDFQVFRVGADGAEPIRQDPTQFFPANHLTGDTCMIATLKSKTFGQMQGQAVKLRAKASIGTGRMNAAFIPTSQCAYTYTPDTNEERRKAVFDAWLQSSKKVDPTMLAADEGRAKQLEREFNTMQVARCYLKDERGEPFSYDFTVESVGVLSVPYIIRRACEVGEAMCKRYEGIAEGDLPDDVRILPADAEMLGFDFEFTGQDHTLRYLLTTFLVENHVDGDAEPQVKYASGDVRHPLRDVMTIRIGIDDGQENTARKAIAAAAAGCAAMFRSLRASWEAATGGAPRATIRRSAAQGPVKLTIKKEGV